MNYITEHSIGKFGLVAYHADGCFTVEEMILAVYSRGIALIKTKISYGFITAVGLDYKEIKNLYPVNIEVACYNGSKNSTINRLAKSVKTFVKRLQV
ncbi:hypothetical protein HZH66_005246 [Vespula vulgaris]|uniref:Uncharacterized protein n=1 Tax=Vespula vulgaris TaxID=7454 RepID=A0A834NCD9_VESVU|nr:hypothetical protein HZH66_005246 [Vespula vulgaris]